jgi:NCS1 family nucleobase:cation symporter-1
LILQIYTFAWIFGFVFSLLSYYVICIWISPPTSAQVEKAVYPPMAGDDQVLGSVTPESGEEVMEKVKVTVLKEKEIV